MTTEPPKNQLQKYQQPQTEIQAQSQIKAAKTALPTEHTPHYQTEPPSPHTTLESNLTEEPCLRTKKNRAIQDEIEDKQPHTTTNSTLREDEELARNNPNTVKPNDDQ